MASKSIFSNVFANGVNGVIESVASLPYLADKQSIGRIAKWATAQACRVVGSMAPTKYKNKDFSGFFRKAILATLGSFGSAETKNIDAIRARVWLTKPLEFLRASVIESSRKAYDTTSQNFHAEFELDKIVTRICDEADRTIQVPEKVQSANPRSILEGKIRPLIHDNIKAKPLTMAEAASKITEAVLPEVLEQGMRIFIVTTFTSYLTDSPFLSTMGTVLFLTVTASTFSNSKAVFQVSTSSVAALSALYWYGGSQWLSTILSVGALGLWWGCLANQKTKRLAKYKPPEDANRVAQLVEKQKESILQNVNDVLDPIKGMKEFEVDLGRIRLSSYPFAPFIDRPWTSPDQQKRVRHKEPAKEAAPKKFPYRDAENLRKEYERKHREHEKRPDYWQLVDNEYVAKANYYKGQKEWNKYVTCIKNIVAARFTRLSMGPNVEAFNHERQQLYTLVSSKLKLSPFDRERELQSRLEGILQDIKAAKHPDDV